jgi:hypothetical protein
MHVLYAMSGMSCVHGVMNVLSWMTVPRSPSSGNGATDGIRASGSRVRREKWCIVSPASGNGTEDEEIT